MNEQEKRLLIEYEKSLVLPESKLATGQFIVCPVGLVGSGKTTVIKPIAEKLGLVRISSDEMRKLFKENGIGYDHIFEAAAVLVQKYLELGYDVALDGDCADERTQRLIRQAEKERGLKVYWIHINPPEEFIIHKLRNFKHTWLFRDADQAVKNFEDRKSIHRNLSMPFAYIFDTSKDDLNKQIEEFVAKVRR